jgi:transposase
MCQKGFQETQNSSPELVEHIQKNISDGGYDGKDWAETMKESFGVEIEITERTDIKNGVVAKIRWISERTFAWLDKNRRLSKNYEGTRQTVKSMIILVFIKLLCRALSGLCYQKWSKKLV